MTLQFRAIVPRRRVFNVPDRARLLGLIEIRWAGQVLSTISPYPPQATGSRYRRTGTLGRNWRHRREVGADLRVVIENPAERNARKYAGYVSGYRRRPPGAPKAWRQTNAMRARGWLSLEEVGRARWRALQPDIRAIIQGKRR